MAQAFQNISWEAEEYIVRDRNIWWYIGLILIGVGLSAIAIWQGWWTFLILVILSIITILTSNLRPPRKIKYTLSKDGLTEGTKLHKYEDFKAFGILKEGSHFSAVLIPQKRFGLSVKVYFPGDSGEGIVDALGSRLPMEEVKLDFLDKIVNFLRI
ncbi:hypothetical protein IKG05_00835 [Candidatus Saccharibacteria bacterium]|nr:hypothetical protein [Candidatus Saccharibacteria bacterium]